MSQAVVVVGAGQAAQSLVETLRGEGFDGAITLIGEEDAPPYQRPPLSKKYLMGQMARERLFFRTPEFYTENRIALKLGRRVAAIDRTARRVRLENGETLGYDLLALTTGARPRLLPESIGQRQDGARRDPVPTQAVRTLADIDRISALFTAGRRVLIVGGGYIGLEAASVAAGMGLRTTLIELAPRILARVAAAETAAYFTALHESRGVDIRVGTGLERLEGDGGAARAVLSTGETLAVDFVLVGVGVLPNTELAEAAGLSIDNGVAVDAAGRGSDPSIFAAGDCASFPWRGRRIRLESVQNAIDQARIAARAMLGQDVAYDPVPWFWSDQYEVKLQIAGLNQGFEQVVTRPGGREGARSVWYFQGARLLAVDAMNDPRAYMTGKRWLEQGRSPDPAALADADADLTTL